MIGTCHGNEVIRTRFGHRPSIRRGRLLKAVVFDFGRVISSQKPQALFCSYEKDLGLPGGSINTIMFESDAWQDALLGRKTYDEFWQAIGPRLGLKSRSSVLAFQRRYHGDERINGDVLKIIRRLYGRYRLAVLSNSPPGLSRWLADWDAHRYFDTVFCSGDEGLMKPDERVFHTVLSRLGLMPSEVVFIDDMQEHIDAARAIGMHAVLFETAVALEKELRELIPF